MNHGKAKEELEEFEHFKCKKYQPKVREVTARCLTGELCQIMVGPVNQKGKKLSSGHNHFEHIDVQGCIDFVRFFSDHSKLFPTLWIVAQHESSRRVVEVGCAHYFCLSGLSPRQTRLGVRTYKCLAILLLLYILFALTTPG
jgi:hypothetical protein